jgi:shikimate dehydrogenase
VRLALLGDPVDHSRSPAIHAAAFAAVGMHGFYEARRVDGDGVAEACREMRAGLLGGANVTMPWKSRAADECDEMTGDSARIGAVNTLVPLGGRVHGHNTDVAGIRAALDRFPPAAPVVVLGAGSTAGAALLACDGRAVTVAARRVERAEALVGRVGVEAIVGPWEAPPPGSVIVNATPIGMGGEALPAGWMEQSAGLVDLAYGADETPAVAAARASGLLVADGIDVLVAQAAASFELWTGVSAPLEAMERAART